MGVPRFQNCWDLLLAIAKLTPLAMAEHPATAASGMLTLGDGLRRIRMAPLDRDFRGRVW